MSKKSKGNRIERLAQKELEDNGWSVHRQHRKPLFIHGKMITKGADIFGADLIAMKHRHLLRWINTTVKDGRYHAFREFEKFPWNWTAQSIEVWEKLPRAGWRKWRGYGPDHWDEEAFL